MSSRQDSGASEILPIGIAFPSLVASAFFLCLDDRRISGDFCSGVALMSIRFPAGLSGDGVFFRPGLYLTIVKWTRLIRIGFLSGFFFLRAPFSR